jgi:hypothetical protein
MQSLSLLLCTFCGGVALLSVKHCISAVASLGNRFSLASLGVSSGNTRTMNASFFPMGGSFQCSYVSLVDKFVTGWSRPPFVCPRAFKRTWLSRLVVAVGCYSSLSSEPLRAVWPGAARGRFLRGAGGAVHGLQSLFFAQKSLSELFRIFRKGA